MIRASPCWDIASQSIEEQAQYYLDSDLRDCATLAVHPQTCLVARGNR
jgi:hypothetical protein